MPYYVPDDNRKVLDGIRRDQVCAECGGRLEAFYDLAHHCSYVQCKEHPEHEGIARPMFDYELNIVTRREIMVQEHGANKALALRRFDHLTVFKQEADARKVLETLWPRAAKASPEEFSKALSLCIDYGADPRIKDLYMIPFKEDVFDARGEKTGTKKETFEVFLGIKFTRKAVRRKHKVAFLDGTPRLMTAEEEHAYCKTDGTEIIRYITKIKDMVTGETATGKGEWPMYRTYTKDGKTQKYLNKPKGGEKGNTMENMAEIRSERAAYDKLYPLDLPENVRVFDEQYIEAEYRVVSDTQPSLKEAPTAPPEPPALDGPPPTRDTDPSKGEEIDPEAELFGAPEDDPIIAFDVVSSVAQATGEVPMSEEEKIEARKKLQEILDGVLHSLLRVKGPDKKPKYTQEELLNKMSKVAGVKVEKIFDIPDAKLSAVANEMDLLLQISG
jgi:hypothetical protein